MQNLDRRVLYNAKQGFSDKEVRLIQTTVGAKPDGVWGPDTVKKISEWQRVQGLKPDGMITNDMKSQTWPAILAASGPSSNYAPVFPVCTRLGAWVDHSPKSVLSPKFAAEMREHNLTVAALMLDTSRKPWDPKYTREQVKQIVHNLIQEGIETSLTAWPFPDKAQIDSMLKGLISYVDHAGGYVKAIEVDTEFNWNPGFLRGFPSMAKASDYLVSALRSILLPLELTTFTSHRENSSSAMVADDVDLVIPQAYSVRNRSKFNEKTKKWDLPWKVDWDHVFGPGNMVRHTLDLTATVPGKRLLGVGLAAYDQVWPGKTASDAMSKSFAAALQYNPHQIRYWSTKWIFGNKKNGYASKFLKAVKLDKEGM